MTTEQNPNPNSEPQSQPAPEPTVEQQRIDAIESELENYTDEKIAALERGSQRIAARGKRTALMNEKSMIQLKPVLDAPERASEPADEPEPRTEITLETPVSKEYEEAARAYAADAAAIGKVAGIEPSEMNVLFNFIADGAVMAAEADAAAALHPSQIPGPDIANRRACETILHRRFGNMASRIIEDAVIEFKKLPASVQRWLDTDHGDGRLVSNHPDLIIGLALRKNGFSKLTPEAAERELNVLRGQKTLDALGKAKIRMLALVAARGKSSDHASLTEALKSKGAKPALSTKSKLEAELKTIRLEKGYWDRSAANHKALTSRMAQIMAELHGAP